MSDFLPILPWPRHVRLEEGSFHFATLRIEGAQTPGLVDLTDRFAGRIHRRFGKKVALERGASGFNLRFRISNATEAGDESYELDVSPEVIDIRASDYNGFHYALETLLQLVTSEGNDFTVPCIRVQDHPRFRWRGLLLDPVRHWLPVCVVKQTLEGMAAVKLNVLHWHLTDDQAFRIECETFPRLHQVASRGQFYSSSDVAGVIRFAATLGIRVVPEFDVPGHATSWVAAYPHLGCRDQAPPLQDRFGIFDCLLNPARESTYGFLDSFLAEMAERFPDDYLHIGGDEVNGNEWRESAEVSAHMVATGVSSAGELQAQFTQRVCNIVRKHGKLPISWEEGASPAAAAQTYKTAEAAEALRASSREVIVSHGFYLDVLRGAAEHYAVHLPDPAESGSKCGVIGGEACLWSEFVTEENIVGRLWPRLGAVAERLWSPADTVEEASLYARLNSLTDHLLTTGVDVKREAAVLLGRIAPAMLLDSVSFVSEALEPVKDYYRVLSNTYDVDTPLNRLVDVIPPESLMSREIDQLTSRGEMNRVADYFDKLEKHVLVLVEKGLANTTLAEIVPLLERLGRIARLGHDAALAALGGTSLSDAQRTEIEGINSEMSVPVAELVVPLIATVMRLPNMHVDTFSGMRQTYGIQP